MNPRAAILVSMAALAGCGSGGPRVVSVSSTSSCPRVEVEPRALADAGHWVHARVVEYGSATIDTNDASGSWTYAVLAVERWYPVAPVAVEANPSTLLVAYQTAETRSSGGHGDAPPNRLVESLCASVGEHVALAVSDSSVGSGDGAPAPETVLAQRFDATHVRVQGRASPSILPAPDESLRRARP